MSSFPKQARRVAPYCLAARRDEPDLVGHDDQLCPITGTELHQQPTDVRLRRRGSDEGAFGHLDVGPPASYEGEHFQLTIRQTLELHWRKWWAVGSVDVLADELLGDAG